jgi:PKD repeat protein
MLALAGFASAQMGVGSYSFTQSLGTYVPLSGGTVIATATSAVTLDDVTYAVPLPFTFTFDGVPQTAISVQTNGWLSFGSTLPATSYTPLSQTTALPGVVSAFGRDLQGGYVFAGTRTLGSDQLTNVNVTSNGPLQVGDTLVGTGIATGTTVLAIAGNVITMSANATATSTGTAVTAYGPWSEMRYETQGTSPNQVFVVQWSGFRRYGTTLTTTQDLTLNFQIRLYETTGVVEAVYGNCTPGVTTFTTTSQVGLRGPNNTFPTNINNLQNTKGVNDDWLLSVPGTSNTSGMLFNNVAPANVITSGLTYQWGPPVGAYAGFTADVTGGPSPLAVQFTDQSFTTAPGGITSWAWDLDGDNVIDSNLQNPSFVYTNCGSYNVSLTVGDGTNPPNTLTRTAYINTDRIAANFTSTVIGPLTVQFTDTSNMPATSWAWDLDGDNVTDSTAQNPSWVYANPSAVNVTLTVTRLCAPSSTVTKSIVPLQQISHNVAPNNGLSSGASVYFDANISNPLGITIGSMDVFGSVVNVPFTVDMYVKQGTHLGFEGTAAEWTLVGTASGTSASANTLPSNATFPQGIYLPSGLFGIKLLYNGTGPRYQTLTAPGTVTNGDLSLTVGVSRGTTVALPWSGSNIANRGWSGTLYYGTQNVNGLAAYGTYGPGCAGSMGVSRLTGNLPQLGTTLNVTVSNLPFNAMFMLTGWSKSTSLFGPLPFDVGFYGAPGCFGRASTETCILLLGTNNSAVWSFVIPNDPGFQGMQMYNQAVVLDTGFNALGAVMSDAAAMLIGM